MKLNTKINKTYFFNSALIFILAVIVIFIVTNYLIKTEIDEQLLNSKIKIINNLKKGMAVNFPPFILVEQTKNKINNKVIIKDTTVYSEQEKEYEPYRQLTSFVNVNDKNYKIILRTSLVEKEDLFISIAVIISFLLGALIVILIYINQRTTKEILKPFYHNLNQLKLFSLKNEDGLKLKQSEIDEFTDLNNVLIELTERAKKEYNILKEFTEDLNHELQTPIAVIKSKLDLLLQEKNLDETTSKIIQVIQKNIGRINRTNKSIVLLSKLENKIFFDSEIVEVKDELLKVLEIYEDFADSKNLTIEKDFNSKLKLNVNKQLLNILLTNLISNSIKHNTKDGKIKITLGNNYLEIENSGSDIPLKSEKIFSRFFKSSESFDSLGLGLAIVKKICQVYQFQINYTFLYGVHKFRLVFF